MKTANRPVRNVSHPLTTASLVAGLFLTPTLAPTLRGGDNLSLERPLGCGAVLTAHEPACGRAALLRRPDFWAERQLSPTRLMERNNPKDACRRHSAIA